MKNETSATRFRRDPNYYKKELENNAKRNREKQYNLSPERREQTERITAKIEKEKKGTGLYMRIAERGVEWPIMEDEIGAIMQACIDYLDDNARTSNYKYGNEKPMPKKEARKVEDCLKLHRSKIRIQNVPFVAIGNDELGESIGETVKCPNCGKKHQIKYGEKINKDGSKTLSKSLGFVRCWEKSYLVAMDGKKIK